MRKTITSLVFIFLLSSCSVSSENNNISSSIIISSSNLNENNTKENEILKPTTNIVDINLPRYEVDLTSIVNLPKTLKVQLSDGTNIEKQVKWKRSFVAKKEKNTEEVIGYIDHDKIYEVSLTVEFKEYKIEGSIENYLSIENEKIKLFYTKNDEHEINKLFDYLTNQYDDSLKFMGISEMPQIKGYIFPNAFEVNNFLRTRMSVPDDALGWGAGLNHEIFVFVSPNNPPEPTHISTIYNIAHHEMVHTLHFHLAKTVDWMGDLEKVPTWLSEGLATYLSMSMIMQDIYDPVISNPNFKVSDLNSRGIHNLPYAPGGMFIKYLVKTYGNNSFIDYLYSLDFTKSFGKTEQELSNEFRDYHNQLKAKNGLNVSYYRIGYNYPEGYNEDNFTQGYVIEEERTIIYFNSQNKENSSVVFNYAYRNNLFFGFAGSRFENEKLYKQKFIIDTSQFGTHFRVSEFSIQRKQGQVLSKIYEGKRIVYIYIKDGDSFKSVLEKLPQDLFDNDYNYIYE